MSYPYRLVGLLAALGLCVVPEAFACGDKFLVSGRGTRYQRPKNARAASVLIFANPASGLPETLKSVPVDKLLKREGHLATTVETLDQLAAILAGGRFDVVLAAASVVAAVEELIGTTPEAPVVVAFCPNQGAKVADGSAKPPCAVKAPPKERSLLEAIDKAVLQHDKDIREARSRG